MLTPMFRRGLALPGTPWVTLWVSPVLLTLIVVLAGAAGLALRFGAWTATADDGWKQAGLSGVLVHSLAFSQRHASLAFAATHGGIYRRDRAGDWRQVLRSPDIWNIQLLPDDRTVIAASNDGTVDVSADAGAHWRETMVSPEGVFAVTARPGHAESILAGAAGGLYLSDDGGLHWQRRLALPNSAGAAFAWQPGITRIVYAGAVVGSPGGSTLVYRSRDAGRTWRVYGRALNSTGGIMSLAAAARRVFAGTMGNAVWIVTQTVPGADGSWRKMAHGMPPSNDHVAGIATVPGRPGTLFVGTLGHGIFRTTDAGRDWMDISQGLPESRSATTVLSVAYSPLQHALYAGTADGVYELTHL